MQQAADEETEHDANNISTWDQEDQTKYLMELMEKDADEQLEKLQEDPVITSSDAGMGTAYVSRS